MTASEYRYLKNISELFSGIGMVKLTDIARKMQLSKASVYRAVERLTADGYLKRHGDKSIKPTDKGLNSLEEYTLCIDFISRTIQNNWKVNQNIAYTDAVNTVCIISDASRNSILNYLNKKIKLKFIRRYFFVLIPLKREGFLKTQELANSYLGQL